MRIESERSFQRMLQKLTEAPGPSGHEVPVQKVMKRFLEPWSDQITTDRLGSLIARRGLQGTSHNDSRSFGRSRIYGDQNYERRLCQISDIGWLVEPGFARSESGGHYAKGKICRSHWLETTTLDE